jgi:hypothetical protein
MGEVAGDAEATVFDFGGVSAAVRVPLECSPDALLEIASGLADPASLVAAVREALVPLHSRLLPAIQQPEWTDLNEEYFVFEFSRRASLPPAAELLSSHALWLANLVRLEREPLSEEEIAESLRLRLSYTRDDLLIPEWSAAFLLDDDCEEILEVIEFANLQLLEFRFLDQRIDERLAEAYGLIHPLTRRSLPFWRTHARALRRLGDLKIDANDVFERTSNALKLLGDQYLARLYRRFALRFHLDDWGQSIRRTLEVAEDVYRVLSSQSATYRTELLEIIIIALIAFEIVMAFFR